MPCYACHARSISHVSSLTAQQAANPNQHQEVALPTNSQFDEFDFAHVFLSSLASLHSIITQRNAIGEEINCNKITKSYVKGINTTSVGLLFNKSP